MTHAPPWLFFLPPPLVTYQIPIMGEITGRKDKFCKNRKHKQGQNVSISTVPKDSYFWHRNDPVITTIAEYCRRGLEKRCTNTKL